MRNVDDIRPAFLHSTLEHCPEEGAAGCQEGLVGADGHRLLPPAVSLRLIFCWGRLFELESDVSVESAVFDGIAIPGNDGGVVRPPAQMSRLTPARSLVMRRCLALLRRLRCEHRQQ